MILQSFLRVLYELFKALVLFYQRIYFPFTVFRNAEYLDFEGAGIIVSNHPNTMVDPLHVVSRTPRQSFFLANASLFKNPILGFLLPYLYCIPIVRPGKDKGVKKVDNKKSFAATYKHLSGGGVLFIAPEGGSEMERRLRPLKTGTARIALDTEAENDFKLGLHIYPVGLTYEQPTQCGSRLYMEAGKPIRVADWQTAYEENPVEAVRELTNVLTQCMEGTLIHTADQEQDQLLYRLERILQHDAPLPIDQHYDRTQQLLKQLKTTADQKPKDYVSLQAKAAQYRTALRAAKLSDRGISQTKKQLLTIPLILSFPIWLYGRINNFFAYEVPRWIERKMNLYIGYRTTVKVLSGLLIIPLCYYLQYLVAQSFLPPRSALIYLISLPLSGILAWLWAYHFQPRREAYQWRKWSKNNKSAAEKLLRERAELVEYINYTPRVLV